MPVMMVSKNHVFALGLAACAIVLANCGGGNVSIPAGHPGATPIPTASAKPTANPSATATATATATAKPTATASPSASPSTSPTPTASPTNAACAAPPPDPVQTEVPIVTSSQPQVINVPCYKDFTGVATLAGGTVVTGTEYAVLAVTTDDAAFDIPDDPAAGTRLLSTAISVTPNTVTLGNPAIATTVTSPTMINPGHVYEAELYLLLFAGGMPQEQPKSLQANLVPNGHTISFNVINPAGLTFPAGPIAYVVIYQNN